MATTKHQTVFTPSTGSIDIYVWQDGPGASEWQVCFQQKDDSRGGYWQSWMERKDKEDETDLLIFPTLDAAVRFFQTSVQAFDLPDMMVAEAR